VSNYYVATTGNDANPGTSVASPFLTIQAGINACTVNGDGVIIAPGTYPPPTSTVDAMAAVISVNLNMFIQGDPTDFSGWGYTGPVILDGNGTAHSYIEVQGIVYYGLTISLVEIQNCRWNGVLVRNGSTVFFTTCYIHNIGNRFEASTQNISGIMVEPTLASINPSSIVIDSCQFANIGRTNDAGDAYDNSVLSQRHCQISNNVFCSAPSGWHIKLEPDANSTINGNWFFGPSGYGTKPGQIMFSGAVAGVTIRNNVFYDPRTSALATASGYSILQLFVDSNQVYTNSGATLAGGITGGVFSVNTVQSLASWMGGFPCGSGFPYGNGGIGNDTRGYGLGGLSAPSPVFTGLGVIETSDFTNVFYNKSIGGGTAGIWGPAIPIYSGYFPHNPGGPSHQFLDADSASSGASSVLDRNLGFAACDYSKTMYQPPGTGAVPIEVVATNINHTVEGPFVMTNFWNAGGGVWEYNNTLWLLGWLYISQRVVMLGSADLGVTWQEYDSGGSFVLDFSYYDGWIQPAARRDASRRYVDMAYVVGMTATNFIELKTFDFQIGTWSAAYGNINLGRVVDFKPGNTIARFSNGDIGIFYNDAAGFSGLTNYTLMKIDFRVYSRLGAAWGAEIPVSTANYWTGNMAPDPNGTDLHLFANDQRTGPPTPKYYAISQAGVVVPCPFVFPTAIQGSDGTGCAIAHAGFIYVPYDLWEDNANAVWVAPIGSPATATFVKQLIPPWPDDVGANPSCSYMVLTGSTERFTLAYTGKGSPYYPKNRGARSTSIR
jgi:hypothetical protein